MTLRRWLIVGVVTALASAWAGVGVSQDRPRTPKRSVLPAQPASPARLQLTEQEIQSFVAEVVPRIEQILGRKFKSIPPIVVDDAEAVARIFAGDLEPTFRKENPEISEAELPKAVLAEARERLPEILGKYGLKVKRLGLMPSQLGPTMAQHHIDPKHGPGIMRLLIAHELTHALQADYVDVLGLLTRSPTEDATGACTAVIEGQAMFVQERVARALKLDAAASQYNKIFSLGGAESDDADSRDLAVYQEFVYMAGKRFVEHHYEKGGAERIWEILAHPPLATSMISRPESYRATLPKRPDLGKALSAAAGEFAGKWTVQEEDVGEIQLRVIYGNSDRTAFDGFAEGVVAARTLSAHAEDGGEGQILLLVLQDGKAAPRAVDFLSQSIAQELKVESQDGSVRVKESGETQYADVRCDASRSHTLVLVDAKGQNVLDKRVVLAARGSVVLQLTTADYLIPKARLAKLIEGILQAAREAVAASK